MSCLPGTSKGTLARFGITMKGKTLGYAGSDYPSLLCQSATLTQATIKEATRVPGADIEVSSNRGFAGSTLTMNFYMDYLSPNQGILDLNLFQGDRVPVLHTRDSVFADPTHAENVAKSGVVFGNWVNISGLPYGGDQGTGFRVDVSGELSGCTEEITSLPAAPATPSSAGGVGSFTFTFTGDAAKLNQNPNWNPSNTPYQTVGYLLEYKLAADTVWTVAPAATSPNVFDITGSPTPLVLDAMDLPGTLHVLNPGAVATTVTFNAAAETYDVRATAVGHWLLKSAPVAETGLVVT